MNCTVCGSNGWLNSTLLQKPDKYEEWMGITDIKRRWRKCLGCGLWHHWRNYDLKDLEKIYSEGYRDPKFRGKTINQMLIEMYSLPDTKSENAKRIDWFLKSIENPRLILDIGSGIGIFPMKINKHIGLPIETVERNKYSIELLKRYRIPCTEEIPDKKYDVISLIHVLEHIETPVEFLVSLQKNLIPKGELFIEVPDAIEFEVHPPIHDDFNSCHTHFYDIPSLCKVMYRAGYDIIDIHREHYEERNLYRIMAKCKKM